MIEKLIESAKTAVHEMCNCVSPRESFTDAMEHLDAAWRTADTVATTAMHLNANKSVAVADDYYWNENMDECPRGVKVQLLGQGGVAVYAHYTHDDRFFVGWAPVPRRRPK